MPAHTQDRVIQFVKRKYRHQIPFAVGKAGTIQMTARIAVLQYDGIIFTGLHSRRHLIDIRIRFLILAFKDVVNSVKIVFLRAAFAAHNVAAVFTDHIGRNQRFI